ncbi:hypothetical protein BDN72DRAFT_963331 [Pluteus cervinus]|uniref:Uncharacterized protein n=1 Tax=Pluteus cervinus TaxID=181527 RepID=A0ACD3AF51_9AGAR|nr:hypothetical protein BDN72DRAFT_963331 [Pluteus cervinus]
MPVQLIPELFDQIFAEVDEYKDLSNLSLVCGAFKALIIPNHLHYRTITTSSSIPRVYAHLAQRPHLAERIRTFHFTSSMPRCPTKLIDSPNLEEAGHVEDPQTTAQNLAKAITSMTRLESFWWYRDSDWVDPIVESAYEPLIFRALSTRMSLVDLCLESNSGSLYTHGTAKSQSDPADWVWQLPNLKTLVLEGINWESPPNTHMLRFLQSAPAIEVLEIPGNTFIDDHNISLPHLRRLELSSSPPEVGANICQFLQNHPTIEDLTWYSGPLFLSLGVGFLPNLKSLKGIQHVINAMEEHYQRSESRSQWKLELIQVGSRVKDLNALQCIDRTTLRKFSSDVAEPVGQLLEMGRLFLNLVDVQVSIYMDETGPTMISPPPLKAWLRLLPQFQNLETFFDKGPYKVIPADSEELRDTILQLAALCPRLNKIKSFLCESGGIYTTIHFKCAPVPLEVSGEDGRWASGGFFSYEITRLDKLEVLHTSTVEKISRDHSG